MFRSTASDSDEWVLRVFVLLFALWANWFTMTNFIQKYQVQRDPNKPIDWSRIFYQIKWILLYLFGTTTALCTWIAVICSNRPLDLFWSVWSIGISAFIFAQSMLSIQTMPAVVPLKRRNLLHSAVRVLQCLAVARALLNLIVIVLLEVAYNDAVLPSVLITVQLVLNVITDLLALATELFSFILVLALKKSSAESGSSDTVILLRFLSRANFFCVLSAFFDIPFSVLHLTSTGFLTMMTAMHGYLFYGLVYHRSVDLAQQAIRIATAKSTSGDATLRRKATLAANKDSKISATSKIEM